MATEPKPIAVTVAAEVDAPIAAKPRRSLARYLPLVILVGLLALVFALGLDRYASLESLRMHRVLLVDFVKHSLALAALAYFALYIALTSLSLPWASLLTIAGGFLFGPWLATGLTVIGATIGAIVVYWIAGSAFGEPLRGRLRRLVPAGRMERIEAGFSANAFAYTLALRLVPVFPFVAVNLAAALLAVPLRAYALGTALGIVPGTAVYALFGAGLGDVIVASDAPALSAALPPSLIGAFFGLALLAIIPVLIRRWRRG